MNSFRFDFFGNGESGGEGLWSYGGYLSEVEQLESAVDFVTRVLGLQVTAIIGHSRGANVVMLSSLRPVGAQRKLLAIAPRWNMANGISSRFSPEQLQLLKEVV